MSALRRGAVGFAMVLVAVGVVVALAIHQRPAAPKFRNLLPAPRIAVPGFPAKLAMVDPTAIKPLTPAEAVRENSLVPALNGPTAPASPFVLPVSAGPLSLRSAVDCLTAAVYYESAGQPLEGQRAVAQVVLNRLRHPAYPKSVCGVVFQGSERTTGCQFTFTCDGSLVRRPSLAGWNLARKVAQAALAGAVEPMVGLSTHYHTIFVVPYWASSLQKITTLSAHIFYRFPGFWGTRAAYNGAYAGESPDEGGEIVSLAYEQVSHDAQAQDLLGSGSSLAMPAADLVLQHSGTLDVPEKPDLRADEGNGALLVDEAERLVQSVRPSGE